MKTFRSSVFSEELFILVSIIPPEGDLLISLQPISSREKIRSLIREENDSSWDFDFGAWKVLVTVPPRFVYLFNEAEIVSALAHYLEVTMGIVVSTKTGLNFYFDES